MLFTCTMGKRNKRHIKGQSVDSTLVAAASSEIWFDLGLLKVSKACPKKVPFSLALGSKIAFLWSIC